MLHITVNNGEYDLIISFMKAELIVYVSVLLITDKLREHKQLFNMNNYLA